MDINYIRRLAFIKYLYKSGDEKSRLPEPLSSTAVLSFHDSIELFLQLSCEYLNCSKKGMEFMGYFDVINKILGKDLSLRVSINKLNRARVDLKHHGNYPSKSSIEYFRDTTKNFLIENCLLIFNIKFDDISLVNLIPSMDVQQLLNNAVENLNDDKYESLKDISIAFAKVLSEYESKLYTKYGNFNNEFSKGFHSYQHYYSGNERPIEEIQNKLNTITDSLLILSLGLDYTKYIKFKIISFYVLRTTGGGCHVQPKEDIENYLGRTIDEAYSVDDIRYCLDFVIESSLIIYSKDFNFSSLHLV